MFHFVSKGGDRGFVMAHDVNRLARKKHQVSKNRKKVSGIFFQNKGTGLVLHHPSVKYFLLPGK